MPGIYGICAQPGAGLAADLKAMAAALCTGWVSEHDRWEDEPGGYGVGRESLGVFNPEKQPIFSPDDRYCLVFDGDLYDTEDLRRRLFEDAERVRSASGEQIALAAYLEGGIPALQRLHGMFCIVIWDRALRQLTVINDRFGLRALYYTSQAGRLAFSSEIKGLLALSNTTRAVDWSAAADFFGLGYILGQKTPFAGIQLLPPASVLTFREGSLRLETYWSLEYGPEAPRRSEQDWIAEMIERLETAVRRRLSRPGQTALPLSGGLDSRLILGILTERLECSLPAYTYGLDESSDVRRAVALANQTKIPHTLLPLGEDYLARLAEPAVSRMEGMANCLDSHGLVLNQIRPNQEILMLGNGGDSFFLAFRAYRRKLLELSGDPVDDFYTATAAPFDEAGLVELFTPEFHNRMAGLVRENLRASFAEMQNNSLDNLYDAHRLREFNRRGLLQGLATTNTHLEFVEPYYDYDLVDFALSLPVEQRWERRLPKQTLAVLAPRLARVEGGPLEPKWTAKRIGTAARARLSRVFPKPVSTWLKPGRQASFTFSDLNQLMASGKNLEWAASILLDRRTAERGMYRPEIVRRLLSEQANGKPGHARRLGALLTFELWQRQFLEA